MLPLLDSCAGRPPLLALIGPFLERLLVGEGRTPEKPVPAQLHGQSCIPPLLMGRQILPNNLPHVSAVMLPGKGKGR